MKTRRTIATYVLYLTGAVVVLGIAAVVLQPAWRDFVRTQQVKVFIAKLEDYKEKHGAYPDVGAQVIVPSGEFNNPYFYQRDGDDYIVGFNIGFDETVAYYSKTHTWKRY